MIRFEWLPVHKMRKKFDVSNLAFVYLKWLDRSVAEWLACYTQAQKGPIWPIFEIWGLLYAHPITGPYPAHWSRPSVVSIRFDAKFRPDRFSLSLWRGENPVKIPHWRIVFQGPLYRCATTDTLVADHCDSHNQACITTEIWPNLKFLRGGLLYRVSNMAKSATTEANLQSTPIHTKFCPSIYSVAPERRILRHFQFWHPAVMAPISGIQRQSWTWVHIQTSRIHATTSKTVPSSNALWAKSFSQSLIAIQERDRSTHPYLTNKNSTFSPPPRRNAMSNPTKLGMVIENLQHVPTAVPLKRSGVPRRPIVLPKRPFTDRSRPTDFYYY